MVLLSSRLGSSLVHSLLQVLLVTIFSIGFVEPQRLASTRMHAVCFLNFHFISVLIDLPFDFCYCNTNIRELGFQWVCTLMVHTMFQLGLSTPSQSLAAMENGQLFKVRTSSYSQLDNTLLKHASLA